MIKLPRKKLKHPAINLKPLFRIANLLSVKCSGRPIRKLIAIIPPIDPIPNTTMYAKARNGDEIVGTTRSIKAALPASPWTMPIRIERGLKR